MVTSILDFIGKHFAVIIPLAAIIMSLTTLFFSFFQGMAIRKHYRTSLKPILLFISSSSNIPNNDMGVKLKNNGLGPAIITDFKISMDGKNYLKSTSEVSEFFEKAIKNKKRLGPIHGGIAWKFPRSRVTVGIQEEVFLFNIKFFDDEAADLNYFLRFLELLEISIKYESVYGEQFQLIYEYEYKLLNKEKLYYEWVNALEIKPEPKADT